MLIAYKIVNLTEVERGGVAARAQGVTIQRVQSFSSATWISSRDLLSTTILYRILKNVLRVRFVLNVLTTKQNKTEEYTLGIWEGVYLLC